MDSLKKRDRQVIWHPYTPMKAFPEAIGIVRGEGATLYDEEGKSYIDAISSWWVNIHGHSNPYIIEKVNTQMNLIEHCMFAGFTHQPAVKLAERLLEILPKGMSKIFYSDNGSTAVEVALKMALQYWLNIEGANTNRKKIIAIENSYHGDTFGAMAVSARSIFTEAFKDKLFDVMFIPFPNTENEKHSLKVFEELLKNNDTAAFISEPLVQGAAGMQMYSSKVLKQYYKLCKKYKTLIIDDEVMTGFGRTGTLFAVDQIDISPDIICLSKGLTGGFFPMGITASTQNIFNAFYDDDTSKMLYHGHSYTANATICASALASLDLLLDDACTANRKRITILHKRFFTYINKHPIVASVRQTGTILAIEIKSESAAYHSELRTILYNFFIEKGVIMRPLGNIIYVLPPYCITNFQLHYIYSCISDLLDYLDSKH